MAKRKRKIDLVYTGDYLNVMRENVEDSSIDLIVTSPPYDGANTPKDMAPDLLDFGFEAGRVLKKGGVCVLVIQDLIHKGLKSCTCLRVPLFWHDFSTLNLWDDYIYERGGIEGYWWRRRIRKDHDFMWVFVNDADKPKIFDKTFYERQGSIFDYKQEKRQLSRRKRTKEKGKMYPVPYPFLSLIHI